MNKLLHAQIYRLRRARLLWGLCALLVLVVVAYLAWSWHYAQGMFPDTVLDPEDLETITAIRNEAQLEYMENNLFGAAAMTVLIFSFVCAWELGAEFQDGAIRNKLSVGHRRRDVYLTSLLSSVFLGVLLCLAVFLPGTVMILCTCGSFAMGWARALLSMAGMTAACGAFAALFTLLGLNISNRTASAVVIIAVCLALFLGGSLLLGKLTEPPSYTAMEITTGGETQMVSTDNPRYLPEGPLREAITFLTDFLPGSQVMQYVATGVARPLRLMAYDGVFFLLMTVAGLLIFRRKDLR